MLGMTVVIPDSSYADMKIIPDRPLFTHKNSVFSPGAPLTYFNDGGVRQRFIFYIPKNPNFRICLPKKIPTFFSIPQKIPQCFCISKFYYLSSGKLKQANFNFGFGQKQNYKLRLCYFWFELIRNIQYPKKSLCCFREPKKSPRLS